MRHTKPTLSNRLRRGLAGILSLALLIGLLPVYTVPAQAEDGHWATPYVNTLVEWDVMRGDINGNMAPERSITRAEFVTMMNRAYGYSRLAGHPFTDVQSTDWYSEDIDIAYNMGYFKGTSPTTASPNAPLTREQAAVLVARNMMLQPTVGETLGFSDTRELAEWSRGLVGAAAGQGILSGYSDGTFKPQNNITRGEVAAMLVRAIGTPVQSEGDYTLGNVYGNVTVNTPGVQLRDGVITGNLYLTGGIDQGDVLLENINVLGDIIVSGGGESDSAESSVILRNVAANNMTVDSIAQQFVTIRAEGNTDIKETTVRTNAYVDDSSLPGYGLWKIIQDGGSLLQLAGNAKEVINKTPNSQLQIAQGVAGKVTIDEKAVNSIVQIDSDARVDELDLDVATNVTGEGDIKDLNVGAAGSSVEQLPNTVTIRPGITSNINGSEMNSSQAAQASAEPMLLAGYPKAKNVAPTSATLVFSVNKPGTIYWAVSAVADGSVSEEDLIENPSYGGKILKSGSIKADKANTEYTANVSGLTQDGSYYISAILVDAQGKRSPVKVTAFATPDGTAPAFITPPTATLRSTKTAQVTGTPNKSCQLYWALLPADAAAPTPAQFKANAITGNVGYGSMDVVKNVSQSVNVNRGNLKEKTNYVAYLWLTDYDGAKSSQVYRVPIYIPDETPPEVYDVRQTNATNNAVEVSFSMNETGKLYWAIVTDAMHDAKSFLDYDGYGKDGTESAPLDRGTVLYYKDADYETSYKIKVISGAGQGAIVSGSTNVTAADSVTRILTSAARGLDPKVYNTSTFYIYYVGEDSEKPGNLSQHIGVLEVNVRDTDPPQFVEYRFNRFNENDQVNPLADTDIQLVFNEPLQHGVNGDRSMRFLNLYQEVQRLVNTQAAASEIDAARMKLAKELYASIKLFQGSAEVNSEFYDGSTHSDEGGFAENDNVLNYRYATVSRENGEFIITFPHDTDDGVSGADLESGLTYHFEFSHLYDCASTPNAMVSNSTGGVYRAPDFRTAFARVNVAEMEQRPMWMAMGKNESGATIFRSSPGTDNTVGGVAIEDPNLSHYTSAPGLTNDAIQDNDPARIDVSFSAEPVSVESTGSDTCYDMLIWSDTNMEFTLYSRPKTNEENSASWGADGTPLNDGTHPWTKVGTGTIARASKNGETSTFAFSTLHDVNEPYPYLSTLADTEYAIHVDRLLEMNNNDTKYSTWNDTVNIRVTFVAGQGTRLRELGFITSDFEKQYNDLKGQGLEPISVPEHQAMRIRFTDFKAPEIDTATITEDSDTTPTIRVIMDTAGRVDAIFVPVGGLQYKPGANIPLGTTKQTLLSDTYIGHISNYAPAESIFDLNGIQPDLEDIPQFPYNRKADKKLELSSPEVVKVLGNSFSDGVVKANSAFVQGGSQALITPPQNLQPDTIYIVVMVAEGSTPQARSAHPVAFVMATQTAQRPILRLSDKNQGVVNASVNRPATVKSWIMVKSGVTPSSTIFGESFAPGSASIDPGKANDFDAFWQTVPAEKKKNYTVLDALQDDYTYGQYPGCSAFDEFATQSLKDRLKNLIILGTGSNITSSTALGSWGPTQFPAGRLSQDMRYENVKLQQGMEYVCVAGAYITEDGAWAFRAASPIQITDDQPPRIINVLTSNLIYDLDDETLSGYLIVAFDKELYRDRLYPWTSEKNYIPVTQNGGNVELDADGNVTTTAAEDNFRGLGGIFNLIPGVSILDSTTRPSRISSITFKFDEAKTTAFGFTIESGSLRSEFGVRCGQGSVDVKWVGPGPNDFVATVTGAIKSPDYGK